MWKSHALDTLHLISRQDGKLNILKKFQFSTAEEKGKVASAL